MSGLRRWFGNPHFMEGGVATRADVLPDAVVGNFGHEVPAAGAFVAAGREGGDMYRVFSRF